MRKPRILISTFTFPPASNGVANAAYSHARILQDLGCEVDIVTYGDTVTRVSQDGLSVARFAISGKGHLLSPHQGAIKELYAFLAEKQWDIVFMHCWQAWSTNCLLDYFAAVPRSEKLILVSHGISTSSNFHPFPFNRLRRLLWLPYEKFTIQKYLRVITKLVVLWNHYDEDRFLDHALARRMGIPVSVIPNVARFNSMEIRRPFLRFTDEDLAGGFLLSVGNYSEEKNELLVLAAYKRSRITDIPLIFVGHQFNRYSAKLEKLAHQWDLPMVQFCERLTKKEIDWLYAHAVLFLSSSKTECQPLVVLDCLASGTACISTNVGCVGSLGCVLVVANVEDMADRIQSLLHDSTQREELIRQGIDLYKKEFSLSSVRNKWKDLITQLLS